MPLVGARRRDRLHEALGAADLELSTEALERIEQAVPREAAVGERYPEALMGQLDSEHASGPA